MEAAGQLIGMAMSLFNVKLPVINLSFLQIAVFMIVVRGLMSMIRRLGGGGIGRISTRGRGGGNNDNGGDDE